MRALNTSLPIIGTLVLVIGLLSEPNRPWTLTWWLGRGP